MYISGASCGTKTAGDAIWGSTLIGAVSEKTFSALIV